MIRHIRDEKEVLERMKKHIASVKKVGFDYQAFTSFLNEFVPKSDRGTSLVQYGVTSFDGDKFIYDPNERKINVCLCGLRAHVINNIDGLAKSFEIEDKSTFCSYLALFSVAAEIEKAYEHLMSDGIIIAPSISIQNGYREIFNLFEDAAVGDLSFIQKSRRRYKSMLYDKERFLHVIDRNANLEAARLMSDVAEVNQDDEIADAFNRMNNYFEAIGYHRDRKGCFNHTFKDIGMGNKVSLLNNNEGLNVDTCIEYGLEVPEETRQSLLKR